MANLDFSFPRLPTVDTVGCKRAVRNQDFGFHFTFRPKVFFRPQILALSPLKESRQRRNQDHSKALALKIEIDMPYALVEPREAYPREKSIFVHVSLPLVANEAVNHPHSEIVVAFGATTTGLQSGGYQN